jgi:hypothetical protein
MTCSSILRMSAPNLSTFSAILHKFGVPALKGLGHEMSSFFKGV